MNERSHYGIYFQIASWSSTASYRELHFGSTKAKQQLGVRDVVRDNDLKNDSAE